MGMFATGLGKDNQVGTTRNGLPNHKRAKPPNSKQPPKQQDCGQGGCSLIKLQNNKRVVCGSRSNVKDVKILIDHDQIQRSPNSKATTTGEYLAETVQLIAEKFEITNKICGNIVSNNTYNNVIMIQELKKLKWPNFKGEPHWI
ncbi:hypothetical protein Pst134EA_011640 [Puccinia striiformis f. sp. tritici]|uniref:DUF659 domain-containing protein n=1 Tax=Puccinia striiformis f. sp. tritici PST-78 TaxID=1165861 RepID=A0A0L0VIL9_9BASI|nr:hypothetical protein Pst134EA_011640 [Puccinia striiformis f. sp. tritici]KAH9468018.1 hypothetical protein Pst134EA_011640 [Puccinia striiformis f. sp. tritici]KNE99108.1 hypothetical protein PSTG_07588 [Puccinia striiformis f. sp. tritici PST-78]